MNSAIAKLARKAFTRLAHAGRDMSRDVSWDAARTTKASARRRRWFVPLGVLVALSCDAHDPSVAPPTQAAATIRPALLVPSGTITQTERNGNRDPNLNAFLTDDLAPSPNVSVTPDGAAAVSVPLWVSPGRAGMQPAISLRYSSRSGNSAITTMGPGWQLSGFPFIHRCARTAADSGASVNASSPITFTGSDQLCVDGEPLVPETAGASINTKNTALRPLHDDHRRFVITAVDTLGPTTIVAYDAQGRTTTWGLSSVKLAGGWVQGPRYSFQTNAQQPGYKNIFTSSTTARYGWLLGTVVDRNGNGMDYNWYSMQCGNGDDLLPGNGTLVALSQVNYTWNTRTGLGADKHLAFGYNGLGCGVGPGESPIYVAGMRIDPRLNVTDIKMIAPNHDGSANITARHYYFTYGLGGANDPAYYHAYHLTDMLDCDGGYDSDTKLTCRPGLHFDYGDIGPLDEEYNDIDTGVPDVRVVDQSSSAFPPRIYSPDLNRDGRDDIVYMLSTNTNYVARASEGPFDNPHPSATPYATGPALSYKSRLFPGDFYGIGSATGLLDTDDTSGGTAQLLRLNPSTGTYTPSAVDMTGRTAGELADLNGDGLPDLVETTTPLVNSAGGTTTSFAWSYRKNNAAGNVVTGGTLPLGPNDHRLVDVDGDGSSEILTVLPAPFDPNRMTAVHAGTPITGAIPPTTLDYNSASPRPFVFADINGDGLSDAIELGYEAGDGRLFIWMNSGNGFFPPIIYTPPQDLAFGSSFVARVIDFNNDGKQDILFRQKFGFASTDHVPLYVLWFDGFTLHVDPLPSTVYSVMAADGDSTAEGETIQVLDFNGDGLDDIAMVNYPNGHNDSGDLHIYRRTGSAVRTRLLSRIDRRGTTRNGVSIPGEEIDFAYKPIADPSVYWDNLDDCFSTQYPTVCMDNKLWVVSSTWRTDDAQSTQTKLDHTDYKYQNARRDLRGRGLLGFKAVIATQPEKGVATTTQYDLGAKENTLSFYPFASVPTRVDTTASYTDPNGNVVNWRRSRVNTLATVHTGSGSFFVYPQTSTDSVVETYVDNSTTTLSSSTTTSSVDANGNPVSTSTTYSDGGSDSVGHIYTYVNDGTWPRISTDVVTDTSAGAATTALSRVRTLSFDTRWNLTSIVALPSGNDRGEQTLTTSYSRTTEGLPTLITYAESAARGGTTRKVTYTYDTLEHAFPASETDGLGHKRQTSYHPAYGLLALAQDENGQQTSYTYDGFARPKTITLPTGASSTFSYVSAAGDPYAASAADTLVRTLRVDNSGAATVVEANWRGLPTTRRVWSRPDGKPVWETYAYDPFNRLYTYTAPSFGISSAPAHVLHYDALDRLTAELRPDGSLWRYDHNGLDTFVSDVTDTINVNTTTVDGRGRVVKVIESYFDRFLHVLHTTYEYGPFDTVYRVTDSLGNVIVHEANRLGQTWHSQDRDEGERYYAFNAFGGLETETTPQYTESYAYDTVGRLATTTVGTRINKFTWDTAPNGIGKLGQLDSPDGITTVFGYSTAGQATSQTWTVSGEKLALSNTYDPVGRLASVTYPPSGAGVAPLVVKYNYDVASGALASIVNAANNNPFWTYQDSDASGTFRTVHLGAPNSGVTIAHTESSTTPTTLGGIQVKTSTGTLLRDLTFTSDGRRNITSRADNVSHVSESFDYDALNRLQLWTFSDSGPIPQTFRYAYDGLGNLVGRTVTSGAGSPLSFNFDTSKAGPHQLVSSTLGSYAYDGNGRQTGSPGRIVGYNELDLPTVVTSSSFSESYQFAYDGKGARVLKQRSNGDVTLTLGELFERRTPKGGTATWTDYVVGPGGAFAGVATTGGATKTYYLSRDQRASVDLVTDDAGAVVDRLAYDPFGARIGPHPPETAAGAPASKIDLGFGGHASDDEAALALVDMKGRVYDPAQYRFLSIDPIFDGVGAQSMNRYAYLGNNPIGWIDPSGFDADDDSSSATGACTGKCQLPDDEITLINFKKGDEILVKLPPRIAPPPVKSSVPQPPPPPPTTKNYDGREAALVSTGHLMTTEVRTNAFDMVGNANKDMGKALLAETLIVPAAVGAVITAPEALLGASARLMIRVPWLIPLGYKLGFALIDGPSPTPAATVAMQESKLAFGAFCFAPTTLVAMEDGTTRRIEDVREGDYVLSERPDEPGVLESHRVLAVQRNRAGVMFNIGIGDGVVVATEGHRFWTERGWVEAQDLTPGDRLVGGRREPVVVRSVAAESIDTDTFNLSVESTHTFFVVVDGQRVLVHNDCRGILIEEYRVLAKALAGTGLQAHHLLPWRFAEILGMDAMEMLAIPVTPGEHQFFTNAWRALIPQGTTPTPRQVYDAARTVYHDFPTILKALNL